MSFKLCFQGLKCLCPCFYNDDSDTDSTHESERPLLDRDSDSVRSVYSPLFCARDLRTVSSVESIPMPPKRARTYGSSRRIVSSNVNVIFGTIGGLSDDVAGTRIENPTEDDIAAVLGGLDLNDESGDAPMKKTPKRASLVSTPFPAPRSVPKALAPLLTAWEKDTGKTIDIQDWKTVLPYGASIEKIAEASYAEVYRITTEYGTSIVKIMQLKVPLDKDSHKSDCANTVENVVPEIRIMNALAEVPGFVSFKSTYVVQGPPPKGVVAAWERHINNAEHRSYFPHPGKGYNAHSTFLVLELGDAGNVLENVEIESIDQVWDVLLGVIMALSRAEIINEFEHRDLHENNICVSVSESVLKRDSNTDENLRFGFSGLGITLIDYGLSRAKVVSGDIIYNNLESDLAVFQSVGHGVAGIQYDTYRRMREHLCYGLASRAQAWGDHNKDFVPSHIKTPWKDFMPYTNVLWIRFLSTYLISAYKRKNCPTVHLARKDEPLRLFTTETRDLTKRLNVTNKAKPGAFHSAQEVLSYVVAQGWVNEKQLETFGVDEDSLLEVTELEESESDNDSDSSDSSSEDEVKSARK